MNITKRSMENSKFMPAKSGSVSGGKILILGAKGNLGGQLIKIFNTDYEVIAWDRGEIDITDN